MRAAAEAVLLAVGLSLMAAACTAVTVGASNRLSQPRALSVPTIIGPDDPVWCGRCHYRFPPFKEGRPSA